MPKLRTPSSIKSDREIIARIKYGMEKHTISVDSLALAMRTSTKTVYERFKNPGTLGWKNCDKLAGSYTYLYLS